MISSRSILLAVALAAFGGAGTASAADVAFSASLSESEQKTIGLSQLSSAQWTALDAAVKHDVTLARQGNVPAFANSFSERRTPEERQKIGLSLLTATQVAQLDSAVARAIASGSQISARDLTYTPRTGSIVAVQFPGRKWETHGYAEFTVGSTSGRGSFYGGAFNVTTTDPTGKFTASFTMSEYRGKGLPYYCDYGYPWYRY
ncbi:MAG TPA: hypothetical protein VFT72_08400 [Opitutaceae bacterium]|nr:hypothetical protein [Opitutaceae bacterium]